MRGQWVSESRAARDVSSSLACGVQYCSLPRDAETCVSVSPGYRADFGGSMAPRQAEAIVVEERHTGRKPVQPPYLESVNPSVRSIEQVMSDIAPTEIPVLLVGESGTGKDAVAMHLHRHSRRRGQPLRKILGSSVTPEQLSIEAMAQESGTVYLDEVADLSAAGQTRLLQSLAEREGSATSSRY